MKAQLPCILVLGMKADTQVQGATELLVLESSSYVAATWSFAHLSVAYLSSSVSLDSHCELLSADTLVALSKAAVVVEGMAAESAAGFA